ncbi:MAG: restriction endonuclease subunit S [Desulfobulbaceae bacterium]|nr:restriction endonuclease subunit S [Desulfobulbaceae bacterium]HIJ91123.1 restriction endonuclease subunit S [Deltaproteobacteria bacterium]
MKVNTLGEICRPKQWKSLAARDFTSDGYPVYGANGIIGSYSSFNHEFPTIAIGCRGACGFVHVTKAKSYITSNAMALDSLSENECDLNYLAGYLRSRGFSDVITGSSQPQITRGNLEKIQIPLPPLDDQKRIAHLLGKVEGLIARRKHHLHQLDDLLKSVFLEMFGDPVRNEKGWDKPELRHFGKISTGNTPPRKDPSNYSSRHIEWIKTDNISADSVFISQAAEYLSETGATKARTVTKGALMVACIAGSVESIGRAALTDRTVAFNQQINAIQPKKDVNPLFLYVLFKISKAYIQSHASKGMKKILTKGDFEKITMIKPPVELQNQFAAIIKKVDAFKSRYQQSLTNLESLYGALSQKAFKGELDLSRVVLPAEGPEIAEEEKTDVEEKQPMEPLFELSAPETLAVLQTAEGRKSLLGEWLNAWLEQLGDAPLSAQKFMDAARQQLWELAEDDTPDWGVAEYDELKAWVFEALEQRRLTQGYDDANNRVQITAVKG